MSHGYATKLQEMEKERQEQNRLKEIFKNGVKK